MLFEKKKVDLLVGNQFRGIKMKYTITLLIFSYLLNPLLLNAGMMPPPPPPPIQEDPVKDPSGPEKGGPTQPAIKGIKGILGNVGKLGGSTVKPKPSGDFGIENLRLDGGVTYTSFDDSTSNSSGHFREYSLTMTGDLTESDTLSIGINQTRFETGAGSSALARSNGISLTWIHNLTENYGVGAFALLNDVDIEETNGNTYSYAYGALFTTFHSFDQFNLSSVTAIAHADFDVGYDQLFMSAWTVSKPWTDKFSSYLTLTFTDSFKSDPDEDPTYGSWEVGGTYLVNDQLSFNLGFQRTEFLNNYSDNTLLLSVGWVF